MCVTAEVSHIASAALIANHTRLATSASAADALQQQGQQQHEHEQRQHHQQKHDHTPALTAPASEQERRKETEIHTEGERERALRQTQAACRTRSKCCAAYHKLTWTAATQQQTAADDSSAAAPVAPRLPFSPHSSLVLSPPSPSASFRFFRPPASLPCLWTDSPAGLLGPASAQGMASRRPSCCRLIDAVVVVVSVLVCNCRSVVFLGLTSRPSAPASC